MTTTANFERASQTLTSAPPVDTSNARSTIPRIGTPYTRWGYRERLAAVMALVLIGYGADLAGVVLDALAGSRTPIMALTPVFALLIASGYRRPPAGVTDNESDWLFVSILGIIGFAGIALVSARYETLAALWRLDLLGAVLWAACATVILLGARHAQRMWRVWLFALISSTPVPFALAVGALGGSDAAAAAVSVCFGATASYLAGAQAPRRKRCSAAALSLVLGGGLVFLLIDTVALFATVAIAAAAVPVLIHIGMRRWITSGAGTPDAALSYPTRSWRSLLALPLLALLVAFVHSSAPSVAEPPTVQGDWAQEAGLYDARELAGAQRYLGGDADFVRYAVPASSGLPAAAVDVITTSSLAALHDHRNTVWYPTTRPLNFTPATHLQSPAPVDVREIFSNADTATDSMTPHWYALTWDWHTAAGYQQVTVVVNQNGGDLSGTADLPPSPQPLSAMDTLLSPALWVGRQQADTAGRVDDAVIARATEIADGLLAHVTARA